MHCQQWRSNKNPEKILLIQIIENNTNLLIQNKLLGNVSIKKNIK